MFTANYKRYRKNRYALDIHIVIKVVVKLELFQYEYE